jgi:hypothetical protein
VRSRVPGAAAFHGARVESAVPDRRRSSIEGQRTVAGRPGSTFRRKHSRSTRTRIEVAAGRSAGALVADRYRKSRIVRPRIQYASRERERERDGQEPAPAPATPACEYADLIPHHRRHRELTRPGRSLTARNQDRRPRSQRRRYGRRHLCYSRRLARLHRPRRAPHTPDRAVRRQPKARRPHRYLLGPPCPGRPSLPSRYRIGRPKRCLHSCRPCRRSVPRPRQRRDREGLGRRSPPPGAGSAHNQWVGLSPRGRRGGPPLGD